MHSGQFDCSNEVIMGLRDLGQFVVYFVESDPVNNTTGQLWWSA